ncbi:unnamed protein product [Brassica oleracea var. botrytis]
MSLSPSRVICLSVFWFFQLLITNSIINNLSMYFFLIVFY